MKDEYEWLAAASHNAAEFLKAREEQIQKRCIGALNNGACILSHNPCTEGCRLEAEAKRPLSPYSHAPLSDEDRARFQGERDEERARDREFRRELSERCKR